MSTHPQETRQVRKERTRQAIVDAALSLADEEGMAAVSQRQVARAVGIVPTAFYRHFGSVDEVGLVLVEESFASLRSMLRDVRRQYAEIEEIIPTSLGVLRRHVHEQRSHFLFVARERSGGPPAVREAIRHQIELVQRELATDLTRLPGLDAWSTADLNALSMLVVDAMVATAERLLLASSAAAEEEIIAVTQTQMRMLTIGSKHWVSRG